MKIGIITHYYKSCNYGGNLQAYALCRVMEKLGCEASQIAYDRKYDMPFWMDKKTFKYRMIHTLLPIYSALRRLKNGLCGQRNMARLLKKREKAIMEFNQNAIPHSKVVYTAKNIENCVDEYDVFVTGSDQVWHPLAVCGAYLLDFVNGREKPKFSYSASIATDFLTKQQAIRYKKSLDDYQGISVRESYAVKLLKDVVEQCVITTLDPTLMLTRMEWEEILVDVSMKDKYVFCYFLGEDERQRNIAAEFARKRHLRLVTLPHLLGKYRDCDVKFGDEQLYDISPEMLLSLIKNAEYIFTDSFHATAFSLIFEKQHFVFQRNGNPSMAVRIYTLTEMFGTQSRFCDNDFKCSIEYIESIQAVDYSIPFEKYNIAKRQSYNFLTDQLKLAKGNLSR